MQKTKTKQKKIKQQQTLRFVVVRVYGISVPLWTRTEQIYGNLSISCLGRGETGCELWKSPKIHLYILYFIKV